MTHKLAFEDWFNGMKYKDIAEKYGVKLDTVKSWYRRHNWKLLKEERTQKSVQNEDSIAHEIIELVPSANRLRRLIEKDLKNQLFENGATHSHYIDLVDDYLALWDVKNLLIGDIQERGVTVLGVRGEKKNDSISELNKTNAQMLKILSELGLKATEIAKEDDEGDDV